jgi:large conductance mechanosensitive channel
MPRPLHGEGAVSIALERRGRSGEDPRTIDRRKEDLMLKEFRDFLLRGNIVELAVKSFVDNLVMPVIAMIIGKPDFSDLTFTINDAVFRYGAFITEAVSFVAIAAAVFFFVVKPIDALTSRRQRTPAEEGMPDEERRHQELLAALGQLSR